MLIEESCPQWKDGHFLWRLDLNDFVLILLKPKSTKKKSTKSIPLPKFPFYTMQRSQVISLARRWVFPLSPASSLSDGHYLASLPMCGNRSREKINQGQPVGFRWAGLKLLSGWLVSRPPWSVFACWDRDSVWLAREALLTAWKQRVEFAAAWIPGCHTLELSFSGKTGRLYNQW